MLFGIMIATVSVGIITRGANFKLPPYGSRYEIWNRVSPGRIGKINA
jgi:hypothetical protein